LEIGRLNEQLRVGSFNLTKDKQQRNIWSF